MEWWSDGWVEPLHREIVNVAGGARQNQMGQLGEARHTEGVGGDISRCDAGRPGTREFCLNGFEKGRLENGVWISIPSVLLVKPKHEGKMAQKFGNASGEKGPTAKYAKYAN
jgi:hypothetical protein